MSDNAPPPYSTVPSSSSSYPADSKVATIAAVQAQQQQQQYGGGGSSSSSSYPQPAQPSSFPSQQPSYPPKNHLPYELTPDMERFRDLIGLYEISELMAGKLRKLDAYDVVIVCDDSGSMNSPSAQGDATGGVRTNPYGPKTTRWDELKYVVKIISAIATTLDEDGIDIYFLNRPGLRNVKNADQIDQAFTHPPSGGTPINRILRQVLHDKRPVYSSPESSKKLLILIATDGEPTDEQGIHTLRTILTHERQPIDRVHVIFVACTDDEAAVSYLNQWDRDVRNVDVVDDYWSERREVLRVQGPQFMFSKGDWVCKILLGSVDPEIDHLDEWRVGTTGLAAVQQGYPPPDGQHRRHQNESSGCCVIL
ncbi:hypothetical protein HK097_004115 [Rhizophlyctis rosea]|uniref:VWFA domain-containing protein n=1 Tax=Rhizophlyctis rosea TaxID=64517 RepID=A0AAD5X7A0_9FUNG|nr:hypothetical protein HK097_004115 [Rhizophlyctis rosea]